jgi:hypothetical protein
VAAETQALPLRPTAAASDAEPARSTTHTYALLASASLVVLYLVLSFLKMKAYWLDGRVWAEEGTIFFAGMQGVPWLARLFFLFHGHLSLATNIVVMTATWVDFRHAPLVLVYGSWLLQSIPILILIRWRDRLGLSALHVAVFCVVIAGLAQAPEVWANATNLHFHFSLATALIAALPTFEGYPTILFRTLLLVGGLTSLPSDFLLPVLLVSAKLSKSRERYIQAGILAAAALVQFALLAAHHFDTGQRSVSFDPLATWLAIVAQVFISPLFGTEVGAELTAALRSALTLSVPALLFAAICSVPLLLASWRIVYTRDRRALVLAASALVLSVLSILTSLDDKNALISPWIGGRYFFVPNACLLLALLLDTPALSRIGRALLCAVMVAAALPRLDTYLGGQPWSEAYAAALSEGADLVSIWPSGWTMPNFAPHRAHTAAPAAAQPAIHRAGMAEVCSGSLDLVQGDAGAADPIRVTSRVHVRASLAPLGDATSTERTPVSLILRQNLLFAVARAQPTAGPAIPGSDLAKPVPFETDMVLGNLPAGRYVLALGELSGDTLRICPNWHVPIEISH